MKKSFYLLATFFALIGCGDNTSIDDSGLPPTLPPIPEIPAPEPIGSVKMGDLASFEEVQLDLPLTDGPFQPSWESIEENYPGTPEWLREAKVGFWISYGPQDAGMCSGWYARELYKSNYKSYSEHNRRFGHPSEVGYKDVLRTWNPQHLDPEYMTKLYKKAGGRFLMIMGVHHDNFDLWNSRYQPWNSVNMGPHRDLLREWSDACKKHEMRYGVTFHHEYTWWWWQSAFLSDDSGDKAGVPYDGHLTLEDGKGKWWEGYDPRQLYGIDLREYASVDESARSRWNPPTPGIYSRHLDYAKWYATQWALRMMDVTAHYDPDFIYTDGTVQGPFTGDGTGAGYKCNAMPAVMADFYNRSLRNRGKVDVFSVVKFRKPTNGTVNTAEFDFPSTIDTSQTWIRENAIGDWFYAPGFVYDSGMVIRYIIESVARDGNVCINVCMRPDGTLEDAAVDMLERMGEWMEINGEAIYGSKAWTKIGEGEMVNGKLKTLPGGNLSQYHADFKFDAQDIRFTVGKNGKLYAFCMNVPEPGQSVTIHSITEKPRRVKLLGYKGKLEWSHSADGLTIIYPKSGADLATSVVFRIE